jgi:hypothetical protein
LRKDRFEVVCSLGEAGGEGDSRLMEHGDMEGDCAGRGASPQSDGVLEEEWEVGEKDAGSAERTAAGSSVESGAWWSTWPVVLLSRSGLYSC